MTNYIQLGQAAINSRNTTEAVHWFEKAVDKNPQDAQALACLGQTLCWANLQKQGLTYLHKAGKQLIKSARKSKNTQHLLAMAEQLQFWNDYPSSLELVKQAVQINKKDVRGFQILAHTYARLNNNKLALLASQQAVNKAPENVALNIQQATLEAKNGQHDTAIKRLQKILERPASNEELFRTHKELALVLDKTKQYHQVFNHLYSASTLAQSLPEVKKQNPSFVTDLLKTYTTGFTKELIHHCCKLNPVDNYSDPVFLIGFLRSGTTLTQEILDTHSDTFISDETDLIFSLREELGRINNKKGTTPEQLKNITTEQIKHLRQFYWNRAINKHGEEITNKLLIDKTTMNTFDVGLINCIFPNAKVIFVMRDPRDVCLSCFMQIMVPTPTTIHLLSWGKTINLYAQTMTWWMHIRKEMSLDFIEFRYEDAITDFETTFRKTFNFLDLEWTSKANDFHKHASKKFIASPSFNQVSQPLYSSSLARWKHYETEFSPVTNQLLPFIKAFNYQQN